MTLRSLVLATAALAPVAALASEPTPRSVSDEIARLGARGEAARLNAGTGAAWETVLRGIGSGSPDWLALVGPLKAGADGGWTEGLRGALSAALATNATGALAVGGREFALRDICVVPLIEPTAAEAAAFRRAALAGLDEASDGSEAPAARRCRDLMARDGKAG